MGLNWSAILPNQITYHIMFIAGYYIRSPSWTNRVMLTVRIHNGVVTFAAIYLVSASISFNGVITLITLDKVISRATVNCIVTLFTIYAIIVLLAVDFICTETTRNNIYSGITA